MNRRDVALSLSAAIAACAHKGETLGVGRKLLAIAHRGASGERPEHTLAAYRLAIAQGADFIEPDLVPTKDGVLVCRHENDISGTTDVAAHPAFAHRRTTKIVDGESVTGFFTEDFTLAELKTLRCKERLPQLRPNNVAFDGQEPIPTFAEALAVAREAGVGIYPELKHPGYFSALGLDPAPLLLAALRPAPPPADKLFVQCFEVGPLERLAQVSSLNLPCIQLVSSEGGPADRPGVSYADMVSEAGLTDIHRYARGIGVEKSLIIPRGADSRSTPPTDLVARAHAQGLLVHAWTFRAENYFLPAELRRGDASAPDHLRQHGDLSAEIGRFQTLGVDGVFSDFPAAAVAVRDA